MFILQQHRLSIANLQVRQKEGGIESATVLELASWVTDGSIKAMEVTSESFNRLLIGLTLQIDGECAHAVILLIAHASETSFFHGLFTPNRWVTWEVENLS